MLQVLTHSHVIAIPEKGVAGFAGISYNGKRFQIKYLSKSRGIDTVRQRFACLLAPCARLFLLSFTMCIGHVGKRYLSCHRHHHPVLLSTERRRQRSEGGRRCLN